MKDLIDHLFLKLTVQLSVFPEFISFINGNKRVLRIVINKSGTSFDEQLFLNYGFFVSVTDLFSFDSGNSFSYILSDISEVSKEHLTPITMLTLSYSSYELNEFEKAEIEGDFEKAGFLLGYPPCCIRRMDEISSLKELWSNYYLNDFKSNKSAYFFNNRFPIAWGGISPIGELFPCSLICKAASYYSSQMLDILNKFGFSRIVEMCKEHGKRTIYVNDQTGSISLKNQIGYSSIIFC